MPDTQGRTLTVDGIDYKVNIPAGSTTEDVMEAANNIRHMPAHQSALKAATMSHNQDLLHQRAGLLAHPPNTGVAPLSVDQNGAINPGSVRAKTADEMVQDWAANYRAQKTAAKNQPQESLPMRVLKAPLNAMGAVAHGIDTGVAGVIRNATGQTGPIPEDVNFAGQISPTVADAQRNKARLAASHPEIPGMGLSQGVTEGVGALASPGNLALMAGPAALKTAGTVANVARGIGAASEVPALAERLGEGAEVVSRFNRAAQVSNPLIAAGKASEIAMQTAIPGGAVQGVQEFKHDPGAGVFSLITGLTPAVMHTPSAFGSALDHMGPLGDRIKTAITEHPVSGGGPWTDVLRILSDPQAEMRRHAPAVYEAFHKTAESGNAMALSNEFTKHGIEAAMGPEGPDTYAKIRDFDAAQGISKGYSDLAQIAKDPQQFNSPETQTAIKFALGQIDGKGELPKGLLDMYGKLTGEASTLSSDRRSGEREATSTQTMANARAGNTGTDRFAAQRLAVGALTDASKEAATRNAWTAAGGTPEEAARIIATPEFRQAHQIFNSEIGPGPLLEASHLENGGIVSGRTGDLGYWHRVAQDGEGAPGHFLTSGGVDVKDRNLGNHFSSGLSDAYSGDWEDTAKARIGLHRANVEAQFWQAARDSGLSIKLDRFTSAPERTADGKLIFTNPDGEEVYGELRPSGMKFMTKDGTVVPAPREFIPSWFWKEAAPGLQRAGTVGDNGLVEWAKKIAGASVAANLAEGIGHVGNVASTLASERMSPRSNNLISAVLEHAPLPEIGVPGTGKTLSFNNLQDAHNLATISLKDPVQQAKIIAMAKEGVLGARGQAETPKTLIGRVLGKSNDIIHEIDYRGRIAIYDDLTKFEKGNGIELPHTVRFDQLRALGNYNQAVQTGIERALKSTGLNIFATAQFQQIRNGFKQYMRLLGIDPRFNQLPTAKRLSAKARTQLAGGALKKALAWYLTAQVAKQIYTKPQEGEDKFMSSRGAFGQPSRVNSSLGRGVGMLLAGAYNANQKGLSPVEGASAGLANLAMGTVTTGLPNTAISILTGHAPYVTPKKGGGLDFISTMPKGAPNNAVTRIIYGAAGLNSSAKFATHHVLQAFGMEDKPD